MVDGGDSLVVARLRLQPLVLLLGYWLVLYRDARVYFLAFVKVEQVSGGLLVALSSVGLSLHSATVVLLISLAALEFFDYLAQPSVLSFFIFGLVSFALLLSNELEVAGYSWNWVVCLFQ